MISFGDFRFDLRTRRLRYRGSERTLRAKSSSVLLYLAQHPDRLVTHAELFRAAWPGTVVSPTVLRVCIREIRAALGADADRFLVTVPRRGYRFRLDPDAERGRSPIFVGRLAETARLHEALARARGGRRQVVFVSGEAGAGKTALLDHFLEELRADGVRCARGQSLQRHESSDGYASVLDLLNRLCDEADGSDVVEALSRWAPSWLLQLPGHVDDATADRLSGRVRSSNWECRLRELSEAVEHLASERPLVLLLEDLHWSDASTVDVLADLTQRTVAARLLVIGSCRPDDAPDANAPFLAAKQCLRARGLCTEIPLGRLAPEHVEKYLTRRLAPDPLGNDVARRLYDYSRGHALFLVTMADHLLDRRRLAVTDGSWGIEGKLEGTVPEAVGQLAGSMLDALDSEQRRVLEAASVAGATFATAPLADATGLSADEVDELCAGLARQRRLLVEAGVETWPDGTVSGRYEFAHAIYAEALYGRLTEVKRLRLHRMLGERIEAGYSGRPREVAAVLARHFELAGDAPRATHYHTEAALAAQQRAAPREAILHRNAALALLRTLPAGDERAAAELDHLIELGATTVAVRGYAAPETAVIYGQVRTLAARLGMVPAETTAIGGLYTYHVTRAEYAGAREKARELHALAARTGDPILTAIGDAWDGFVLFNLGEFESAVEDLQRARAAWVAGVARLPGHGVSFHGILAATLLIRGESAEAAAALQMMLDFVDESGGDSFSRAQAHALAAQFHALAHSREPARHHAERALVVATEHGFARHRASAMVIRGWAVGDVGAIEEGLTIHADIGQRVGLTLCEALLAEIQLIHGDPGGALETVDRALTLAAETGEARHLAELHRLRGECVLRTGSKGRTGFDAEGVACAAGASLRTALDVARRQKARLWQQRASAALRAAARCQA